MPDKVLDYQTPQRSGMQPLTGALHLASWMALVVWVLAMCVIAILYTPTRSSPTYRDLLDGITSVGPLVNICGALCGITSLFMRDRWVSGVAFLLNVLAVFAWPSLAYV